MKKVFALALALVLAIGLAACGGDAPPSQTADPDIENESFTQPPTTTRVVEAVTDPAFDAKALFQKISGYWSARHGAPDENMFDFIKFDIKDGKPEVSAGVYEGEYFLYGEWIGGRSTGEHTAVLYFLHPAVTEPGPEDPAPEMVYAIYVDTSDIEADGITLKVKDERPYGVWDWQERVYSGGAQLSFSQALTNTVEILQ